MLDPAGQVAGHRAVFAQALDPSLVAETPGTTRAVASFVLTVVVGGAVVYAYGGRLAGAAQGSLSRPLSSVLYGLVAFVVVGVVVTYGSSVLSGLGVGNRSLGVVGAVVVLAAVVALSGVGFAVVGVWVAQTLGLQDPLLGVVVVGTVSAAAWALPWVAVGAVVWTAIVVVGVGGPTQAWVHRDALQVRRR